MRSRPQDVAASSQIGNANRRAARSETCGARALQHIPRVNDRLSGRVDMRIRTRDAPAHLEDLNVAVVQYVVDVAGQTLNGRAAYIFDALLTTRLSGLMTHPPSPREGHPTRLFIRLPI